MTSRTAPGVTRRWSDLRDFVGEVSNARSGLVSTICFRPESVRRWGVKSVNTSSPTTCSRLR